jgi:hypothetical protein
VVAKISLVQVVMDGGMRMRVKVLDGNTVYIFLKWGGADKGLERREGT